MNRRMEMLLVPLRWNWLHSQIKGSSSHKSCPHPSPSSNPHKVLLKEGSGISIWSSKECSCVKSQQPHKKGEGIYTRAPKTSRYCAGYVFIGTSDTGMELPIQLKTLGREPFVGGSKTVPMGVGTSDPTKTSRLRAPHRKNRRSSDGGS